MLILQFSIRRVLIQNLNGVFTTTILARELGPSGVSLTSALGESMPSRH